MNKEQKQYNAIEKSNIANFITRLSNNDFSNANKYLQTIIENKLLKKINNLKDNPLF